MSCSDSAGVDKGRGVIRVKYAQYTDADLFYHYDLCDLFLPAHINTHINPAPCSLLRVEQLLQNGSHNRLGHNALFECNLLRNVGD